MYLQRASCLVGTEVRIAQHGDHRGMIEESDSLVGQLGYIYQSGSIRMAVDQSVSQEVSSFFGIQDVHGSEMLVFRTDADNFFRYLDCVGIFGI